MMGGITRVLKLQRILNCKPMDIFKAVVDVERYPEFLPYCSSARIQKQYEKRMLAEVDFEHNMFRETILYDISWVVPTYIRSVAKDTSYCNKIEYLWNFSPYNPDSCEAELRLTLDFHSSPTAMMFDMFSGTVQKSIFHSFSNRVAANSRRVEIPKISRQLSETNNGI